MSVQHTPGRWECRPIGMYPTEILIYQPDDSPFSQNPVAKTFGRVHPEDNIRATEHKLIARRQACIDEAWANARLIAAAPELLVATKAAERFIAGFEGDELQEGIDELLSGLRAAIAEATGEKSDEARYVEGLQR